MTPHCKRPSKHDSQHINTFYMTLSAIRELMVHCKETGLTHTHTDCVTSGSRPTLDHISVKNGCSGNLAPLFVHPISYEKKPPRHQTPRWATVSGLLRPWASSLPEYTFPCRLFLCVPGEGVVPRTPRSCSDSAVRTLLCIFGCGCVGVAYSALILFPAHLLSSWAFSDVAFSLSTRLFPRHMMPPRIKACFFSSLMIPDI